MDTKRTSVAALLVLDGEQRSALAAVRSAGRAGIPVVVASSKQAPLAGASRYASKTLTLPDPEVDAAGYRSAVFDSIGRIGASAVLPMTDVSTMLLANDYGSVAGARLLAPGLTAYELLTQKDNLFRLAGRLGVRAPRTTEARSKTEILAAIEAAGFPVVLKPARSKYLDGARVRSTAVVVLTSPVDAEAVVEGLRWIGAVTCLVQEFIPGHGAGVFTVFDRGEPLGWFSHRRIREKPPSGGVSVLSESARPDPRMQEDAAKLLEAAGWSGPAMVEFRIGLDGEPYLMEVNGRFWGSLQLAIDAGVDFPLALYSSMLGKEFRIDPAYRLGRKLRWTLGDLDNLLIQFKSRKGAGPAWAALRDFLLASLDPRIHPEIFRWSDPAPAGREICDWLRAAVKG